MQMRQLTASKQPRAKKCLGFLRTDYAWVDEPGSAARVGTAVHKLAELFVLTGQRCVQDWEELSSSEYEDALSYWEALASWLEEPTITPDTWLPIPITKAQGWRPEIKFAYDPQSTTARILLAAESRDYDEARPGEMTGTADLVWCAPKSDLVVVLDYKTGTGRSLEPLRESSQLRFLAFAAALEAGAKRAIIGYVRVREDQPVFLELANMDGFDFELVATELADLDARMTAHEPPEPVPGSHCRYCPASTACPAMGEILGQLTPTPPAKTLGGPIETPEDAVYRFEMWDAVVEAHKAYVRTLKAWAETHGGVRLPNGDVYQSTEQTVEKIEPNNDALEFLGSRLGEHFPTAVSAAVTKASLKRAAQASGVAFEELLQDLRALGAVGQEIRTVWRTMKSEERS